MLYHEGIVPQQHSVTVERLCNQLKDELNKLHRWFRQGEQVGRCDGFTCCDGM